MVQRQIEKVVVSQLLEATRDVLDHLRRWQNHLSQTGADGPPNLSRIYGAVRRLRDYLHRVGVSSYTNDVRVDLGSDDENLLVSCAVHHLGTIEHDLKSGVPNEDDRTWLEEVRRSLSTWAVNFATRPVARIPAADPGRLATPTARKVIAALVRKTGDVAVGHAGPPTPVQREDRWRRPLPGQAPPHRSTSGHGRAPQDGPRPVAGPPRDGEVGPPPTFPGQQSPIQSDVSPAYPQPPPSPPEQASQGLYPGVPEPPSQGLYPGVPEPPMQGEVVGGYGQFQLFDSPEDQPRHVEPLLEPRLLRDPRLRMLLAMDMAAFERTASTEQCRLAMVHLSSVLEGVVVDFALPRQKELKIGGLPESWSLEAILERCLGDRLTSMDRPHLLQMVAARHLVRPAVQLNSPMVVTAATLAKAADFVRRVARELGYTTTQGPFSGGAMEPSYGAGSPGPVHGAPAGPGGQLAYDPGGHGAPGQAATGESRPMRAPPPPWARPGE